MIFLQCPAMENDRWRMEGYSTPTLKCTTWRPRRCHPLTVVSSSNCCYQHCVTQIPSHVEVFLWQAKVTVFTFPFNLLLTCFTHSACTYNKQYVQQGSEGRGRKIGRGGKTLWNCSHGKFPSYATVPHQQFTQRWLERCVDCQMTLGISISWQNQKGP